MIAEDCGVVDVAEVHRALKDYAHKSACSIGSLALRGLSVTLTLTGLDGTRTRIDVDLTTTEPYFGGSRLWFLCPRCERRAGKLYIGEEPWQVGCQACLRLVYQTQYRKSRAAQQGRALRQFLDLDFAKEERKSKRLMKAYLAGRVSEEYFWEKMRNPLGLPGGF